MSTTPTIAAAAITAESTGSGRIVFEDNDRDDVIAVAVPDTITRRWAVRLPGAALRLGTITEYDRRDRPAGRNGDAHVRVDVTTVSGDLETAWRTCPEAALAWAAGQLVGAR